MENSLKSLFIVLFGLVFIRLSQIIVEDLSRAPLAYAASFRKAFFLGLIREHSQISPDCSKVSFVCQ